MSYLLAQVETRKNEGMFGVETRKNEGMCHWFSRKNEGMFLFARGEERLFL